MRVGSIISGSLTAVGNGVGRTRARHRVTHLENGRRNRNTSFMGFNSVGFLRGKAKDDLCSTLVLLQKRTRARVRFEFHVPNISCINFILSSLASSLVSFREFTVKEWASCL